MKNSVASDFFILAAAGAFGGAVVAAAPYVIDVVEEKRAQVMAMSREAMVPLPKNDHLTP